MGLDIYYHRVKHPEYYKLYSRAVNAFGDFENRYSSAHHAEIEASFKIWSDWHDKWCESNVDYDEWRKETNQPFMTGLGNEDGYDDYLEEFYYGV